jgi:hypothetical protein
VLTVTGNDDSRQIAEKLLVELKAINKQSYNYHTCAKIKALYIL